MKTLLKLGPGDHGRALSRDEFESAEYAEGHRYEIIDGRLYVSPEANLPHSYNELWLLYRLARYAQDHPEVINHVTNKSRVFVHDRPELTVPEPDIVAYENFPHDRSTNEYRWEDVSPILAVEVVSASDPEKDLERNVALYLEVPSIREYWVLDGRDDADRPHLLVYRRRGRRWQNVIHVPAGGTYTTRLLPGFSLLLDPHS
jgi:Uma2 family endonuclease